MFLPELATMIKDGLRGSVYYIPDGTVGSVYKIEIIGCDAVTEIFAPLSESELIVLRSLEMISKAASPYSCYPVIRITAPADIDWSRIEMDSDEFVS